MAISEHGRGRSSDALTPQFQRFLPPDIAFDFSGTQISDEFVRKIQEGVSIRVTEQPSDKEFARLVRGPLKDRFEYSANNFLQSFDQRILYEDPDFLIINKPPDIASHGNMLSKFGVEEVARHSKGEPLQSVHRLDVTTSGVLILARNFETLVKTNYQIAHKEESQTKKIYLALLDGEFDSPGNRRIEVGIRSVDVQRMQVVQSADRDKDTQDTITHFDPLMLLRTSDGSLKTLTSVQLITGKKHQIRVVAAQKLGMPISGDRVYNSDRSIYIVRPLLHAYGVKFIHPRTGDPVEVSAPLPRDFEQEINALAVVKNYKEKKK